MDVAREPVALLDRGQLLGLGGIAAQPLVRLGELGPGLPLSHEQLGHDERERRDCEGAEALAEHVRPLHAHMRERDDRSDEDGGRQWQQQDGLRHEDHEEEDGAHRGIRKPEDHEAERQLHADVRPGPPSRASLDEAEPEDRERGVDETHHQRRQDLLEARGPDRQRQVRDDGEDGQCPLHRSTLEDGRCRVNWPKVIGISASRAL